MDPRPTVTNILTSDQRRQMHRLFEILTIFTDLWFIRPSKVVVPNLTRLKLIMIRLLDCEYQEHGKFHFSSILCKNLMPLDIGKILVCPPRINESEKSRLLELRSEFTGILNSICEQTAWVNTV